MTIHEIHTEPKPKHTLYELRKMSGRTATDIAKDINISRAMFHKYESGETRIPLEIVDALLIVYQRSYESINWKPNYTLRVNKEKL